MPDPIASSQGTQLANPITQVDPRLVAWLGLGTAVVFGGVLVWYAFATEREVDRLRGDIKQLDNESGWWEEDIGRLEARTEDIERRLNALDKGSPPELGPRQAPGRIAPARRRARR